MLFLQKIFSNKAMMKGGAWLLLEKILLLGKGLLLTYLYANWLSREVYGAYQFIVAFLTIVSIIVFPGMGVAIVQALARDKDGIFSLATRVLLRAALWGSGVLLVSAGYYGVYLREGELAKAFLLLATVFPGYITMNLWRYYYTGKTRFGLLVRASVVFETISLFSSLAAILYLPHIVWLVFLGIIFPMPFSLLLVWRLCQKTHSLTNDGDAIRFGKSISYTVALSTIALYGDKLILGHFLGFSELALYSIAMIIPEQAKGAITSFTVPLLPQYSVAGNKSELKEHLIFFGLFSAGCALFLSLVLPFLFQVVFPQYVDGVNISRFLLITLIFIPFVLLETFFRSQKKDRVVFRANLVGSVTDISLVIALVPFFGITGAVFARLSGQLAQGISFLFSYWHSKK